MVIDTSAVVAILKLEPEARAFAALIVADRVRLLSAANYVEANIVMSRRGGDGGIDDLHILLRKLSIEITPISVRDAERAAQAHRRFGRGHHPARLNFGDCFAYALAVETGEPLLFKGDDFARTDVARAM